MRGDRNLVGIEIRAAGKRSVARDGETMTNSFSAAEGKIMVRVGLIGFGLAGQAFHAPVIRGVEGMELACILERHGSNAQKKYPEVRVARTLEEMLSDKTISLVVVATPNDSHYSYTKACLDAGRHVVVDKPFT